MHVEDGIFAVRSEKAARLFRAQTGKPNSVIARELPLDEALQMAPKFEGYTAFFENTFGVMPVDEDTGPVIGPGNNRGYHGLWPTRDDYRAAFLLWGPGIHTGEIPEISMLDIGPTFADILGLELPRTQGKSLLPQIHSK